MDDTVHPEALAPPAPVEEEDGEWAPTDAALEEEQELARARAKVVAEEQERLKNDESKLKADASSRMSMLDTLLDKTAIYSQFVSSNIKAPVKKPPGEKRDAADAAVAEEEAPAGKAKRARRASPRGGKKGKKGGKAADFGELAATESATKTRPAGQPTYITEVEMRDYQLQGSAWLVSLWENGMNGILADEMGLGKTLQTIAMLAHLKENKVPGPYMVVAPLSTLANWAREVTQWTKGVMCAQIYHGSAKERDELRTKWNEVDVVVTSFEVSMRDIRCFQRPMWSHRPPSDNEWKYLVIDEGHRLKNKDCRLIRDLKTICSANRLLLTGTPLQNNLNELWSLLNFLLPSIFDDLSSFQSWFDFDEQNVGDASKIIKMEKSNKLVSKLHTILRPFLLRRQKRDVDLKIPPKREIVLYCQNSPMQHELYGNLLRYRNILPPEESDSDDEENTGRGKREKRDVCYDEDAVTEREWLRAVDGASGKDVHELTAAKVASKHGAGKTYVGALSDKPKARAASKPQGTKSFSNLLMQLRKVVNHPYLFPEVDEAGADTTEDIVNCAGKMKLVDRLLDKLLKRGHKVLIFSQMTKILDILEDYMLLRGYKYGRIDGGRTLKERQDAIDNFNTDVKTNVFLLSTRAGGLGINLVAADTVFIYDSDWNPQADLQAQDRAHRIGQKNPVLVYRLCHRGTVEEKMLEKAAAKRKLEHLIVSNGKFVSAGASTKREDVATMSAEELTELLKSNYSDQNEDLNGDMSNADLERVMDRSFMFDKKKSGAFAKKHGESAAFRMLADDGDGGGLLGQLAA